jgi:hypothetical protein
MAIQPPHDDDATLERFVARFGDIERTIKDPPAWQLSHAVLGSASPRPRLSAGPSMALAASFAVLLAVAWFAFAPLDVRPVLGPGSSPHASDSAMGNTSASPASVQICGRLDHPTCDQIVDMARRFAPEAFGPGTTIVADYDCPPGAYCRAGFGAIVVGIPPKTSAREHPEAFSIQGFPTPERVTIWTFPLPDHIIALIPGASLPP